MARLIDWDRFDTAFGGLYVDKTGRPGLPTRLMAGLHLPQHAKGSLGHCGMHPMSEKNPTSGHSAALARSVPITPQAGPEHVENPVLVKRSRRSAK